MLILKDNPFGIDAVINEINQRVYNALDWNTTADVPITYNAYHRAFKNPRNNGVVPEAYVFELTPATTRGKGEYREVFFDDELDASSFFYTDDVVTAIDAGSLNQTTISMVFQVKLDQVANNIQHRGDEEIHSIVWNAINTSSYGNATALVKTIPSVYSEFDTSQVTHTDMQGFHCFRVDIDVTYAYQCCTDCNFAVDETGFLLLEDGNFVLLEDGFQILLAQ